MRPVRMWNINHIPEDVKPNREHAIALLGSVMNSEKNIDSKLTEIRNDKKHLNAWCTFRLKALWIKLACNNGLSVDGRQPANWNDVKESIVQSMKKNGTSNVHAYEVHYGWWARVYTWKKILEEEYMSEYYIAYYPTSLHEYGSGAGSAITTIHKLIRRKFNDLCKDIQKYTASKNNGEYLTSRKCDKKTDDDDGKLTTCNIKYDVAGVQGSYVARKVPPKLPFSEALVCDGSCKHSTDLREMVSVLQQQVNDLKRDHLKAITVSFVVLCNLCL